MFSIVAIVIGGVVLGVAASMVSESMARARERSETARRAVGGPEGYRAPAPLPEDELASPLSVELLAKVLRATDAGANPYDIDVDRGDKRTKLAIAFTVGAVWAVRDRSTAVWWSGGILVVAVIGAALTTGMADLVFVGIAGLAQVVGSLMLGLFLRKMKALRELASSSASPSAVGANLRRIADWPAATDDPLLGWPARVE